MMHTILKSSVRNLKAAFLPSWTGAKKTLAMVLSGTLMYTTLASPLVEAGFWQDRQKAAQSKNSSGTGAQYAMLPAGAGALTEALPFLDGKSQNGIDLESLSGSSLPAAHSSLSPEQQKLLPAWLNHISSAHGTISQAYFAPHAEGRPLIVHIQDVHEQREAQMNISGLINELVGTGAVSLVGLEGATGAFDLTPYRTFPNKAVIGDVADFLVQEHMIGGGEHAGWTAEKDPTLWGVEEVGIYLKNLNSFKEALPVQQRVQDRIKSWEYRLAQVKPKVFSPELKTFDESQSRYKNGTLGLPEYVDLIEKTVKLDATKFPATVAFRHCLSLEKALNFSDVERERARLIESLTKALSEKEIAALVQRTLLYKSGRLSYGGYYDSLQTICEAKGVSLSRFPAMAAYIKYVLASEQIKPEALLSELDTLQENTAAALVRTPEERAVYDLAQDLHSLTNLAAFKMAPHDWARYQQARSRIMDMAARMDRLAPGADNYAGDLPKDLVPFEGFCQAALARDRTLTDNLLAKMKASGQKNAILLTGGFHTEGMTDLLRKEKVSYVVFTPTLTEVSSDSNYLDFLKNRPALEKLFTQEKITTKIPVATAQELPQHYEDMGPAVARVTKLVGTALSGGEVPKKFAALSPAEVVAGEEIGGQSVYQTVAPGGRTVSAVVGKAGATPPADNSRLGRQTTTFSSARGNLWIYVKNREWVSLLSPQAAIEKLAGWISRKDKGSEGQGDGAVPIRANLDVRQTITLAVISLGFIFTGIALVLVGHLFLGVAVMVVTPLLVFGHEFFGHVLLGYGLAYPMRWVLSKFGIGTSPAQSFLAGIKSMVGGLSIKGVWSEGFHVNVPNLGRWWNAWMLFAGPLFNIVVLAATLWLGLPGLDATQSFVLALPGLVAIIPLSLNSDLAKVWRLVRQASPATMAVSIGREKYTIAVVGLDGNILRSFEGLTPTQTQPGRFFGEVARQVEILHQAAIAVGIDVDPYLGVSMPGHFVEDDNGNRTIAPGSATNIGGAQLDNTNPEQILSQILPGFSVSVRNDAESGLLGALDNSMRDKAVADRIKEAGKVIFLLVSTGLGRASSQIDRFGTLTVQNPDPLFGKKMTDAENPQFKLSLDGREISIPWDGRLTSGLSGESVSTLIAAVNSHMRSVGKPDLFFPTAELSGGKLLDHILTTREESDPAYQVAFQIAKIQGNTLGLFVEHVYNGNLSEGGTPSHPPFPQAGTTEYVLGGNLPRGKFGEIMLEAATSLLQTEIPGVKFNFTLPSKDMEPVAIQGAAIFQRIKALSERIIVTNPTANQYLWGGKALAEIAGLKKGNTVAEVLLGSTLPFHQAGVSVAGGSLTLPGLIKANPNVLGPRSLSLFGPNLPVFAKLLQTRFPAVVYLGFKEKVDRATFVGLLKLERDLINSLLGMVQELTGQEAERFKDAYEAWSVSMYDTDTQNQETATSEFAQFLKGIGVGNVEQTLIQIRINRNNILNLVNKIDLADETGNMILSYAGIFHFILGLSGQVHVSDSRREALQILMQQAGAYTDEEFKHEAEKLTPLESPPTMAAPKSEAWVSTKVAGFHCIFEAQETSDLTLTGMDPVATFGVNPAGKLYLRKGYLSNETIDAFADEVEFSATSIDDLRRIPENVPSGSPTAVVERIVDEPNWPYFSNYRVSLKGELFREASWTAKSGKVWQLVIVTKGNVTLTDSRGRTVNLAAGQMAFIPATLMGGYTATSRGEATMEILSVPVYGRQNPSNGTEGEGRAQAQIAQGGLPEIEKQVIANRLVERVRGNEPMRKIIEELFTYSSQTGDDYPDIFKMMVIPLMNDARLLARYQEFTRAYYFKLHRRKVENRGFNVQGMDERRQDLAAIVPSTPSNQFSTIKEYVKIEVVAEELNARLQAISGNRFPAPVDADGKPRGPTSKAEAIAELRNKLNSDLSMIQTAVADSLFELSDSDRVYALRAQTLLMDALLILNLQARKVPGADAMRLTVNPANKLAAADRAESFIDKTTLQVPVVEQENAPGAYNRGIETGKKMGPDLTDADGQTPRNLEAYVLYTMRHGLVPVPKRLQKITKSSGGAISTFHHTLFGMGTVPATSAAASTGVGHFQGSQLDIKQVTRGEAIQVLVAYNEDGSVRDVLYQRAKAGEYLIALPGYYDSIISTGAELLEFDDISINLSQLGFKSSDIKKFNGGVQPSAPPKKAPYVYSGGQLVPARGMNGLPQARQIATVQANQGASLYDIYMALNQTSLRALASSLVSNAQDLLAPAFRGRQPKPLAFGTSGLRGLVTEITDLEVYINTMGYLNYLLEQGQIQQGDTVTMARDFRESSPRIASAVAQALSDFGVIVEDLGRLSTPALTLWGIQNKRVSIMITGSHIPFDRNGIKFNKASGEVVKSDEPGINRQVAEVRRQEYLRPANESLFNNDGMFKQTPENRLKDVGADRAHDQAYVGKWTSVSSKIPNDQRRQFSEGEEAYIQRYVSVYGSEALAGQYYSVYLHSGVGTRLFAEVLRRLGANVYEFGPSDTFIAIDTEAISDETLGAISAMVKQIRKPRGATMTAVLSTDGDSDRPLVLGYNKVGRETALDFIPGDIAGAFVADRLGADAVAVPISANDVVDGYLGGVKVVLKTKIGSPYIVVGMELLAATNKGERVVGWEANGGFLTGVEIPHRQGVLAPLPTRDAVLPMVEILVSAKEANSSISELFKPLRSRVGKADLIDNFPVEASAAIVREFSDIGVGRVVFSPEGKLKAWPVVGPGGNDLALDDSPATNIRTRLQSFFTKDLGFGEIDWIDFTDGIRIHFSNGDIAHIRPSGNAPQLRIYAVADTSERASEIVRLAIAEPDGIYRKIEKSMASAPSADVQTRLGPAGSLFRVKAKPFSLTRAVALTLSALLAFILIPVAGAASPWMVLPAILVAPHMVVTVRAVRAISHVKALSELSAEEKATEIQRIADEFYRLGLDPQVSDGRIQVMIGTNQVTVNLGQPKDGWLKGADRFAETLGNTITVAPGVPAALLPYVLATEIHRVSSWEGFKASARLLPGLRRSSATNKGPPSDEIFNAISSAYLTDDISGNTLLSALRRHVLPSENKSTVFEAFKRLAQAYPLLARPNFQAAYGRMNSREKRKIDALFKRIIGNGVPTSQRIGLLVAGGSGLRFFPMGDQTTPKQFIRPLGDKQLIQMAIERLRSPGGPGTIVIQTTQKLVKGVEDSVKELGLEGELGKTIYIYGEPDAADTGPAVYYGVAKIAQQFGEDKIVETYWADHVIDEENWEKMHQSVQNVANVAGVMPYIGNVGVDHGGKINVGFGHIFLTDPSQTPQLDGVLPAQFTEKPARETIESWRAAGTYDQYVWNTGYAVGRAGIFMQALKDVAGENVADTAWQGNEKRKNKKNFFALFKQFVEAIGTDQEGTVATRIFAVMKQWKAEKNGNALEPMMTEHLNTFQGSTVGFLAIKGQFSWRDVGSFEELRSWVMALLEGNKEVNASVDNSGNFVMNANPGAVTFSGDSKNNSVFAVPGVTVVVDGLEGVAVAIREDKVIVVNRKDDQKVKDIAEALGNDQRLKPYADGRVSEELLRPGVAYTGIPVAGKNLLKNEGVAFSSNYGLVTGYGLEDIRVSRDGNKITVARIEKTTSENASALVEKKATASDARDVVPSAVVLSFAVDKQVTSDPIASVSLSGLMVSLMDNPAPGVTTVELGDDWLAMSPRRMIAWLGYATPDERMAGLAMLRADPAKAEAVLGVVLMDAATAHANGRSYRSGEDIADDVMHQEMQDLARLGFWFGLSIDEAQEAIDRTYNTQRTLVDEVRGERKKAQLESVARPGATWWQTVWSKVLAMVLALRRRILAPEIVRQVAPIVVLPIVMGPRGVEWQSGVDEETRRTFIMSLASASKFGEIPIIATAIDGSLSKEDIGDFVRAETGALSLRVLFIPIGGDVSGIHGADGTVSVPAVIKHLAEEGKMDSTKLSVNKWLLKFDPMVMTNEVAALDMGDFRSIVRVVLIYLGEIKALDLDKYDDKVERYLKAQA